MDMSTVAWSDFEAAAPSIAAVARQMWPGIDAELRIRAQAREVSDDRDARARVTEVVGRSGVGGMIETTTNDCLFEFTLEQVDPAVWVKVGQACTHAERRQWRAGTTATVSP
jgi:hypothetical protein